MKLLCPPREDRCCSGSLPILRVLNSDNTKRECRGSYCGAVEVAVGSTQPAGGFAVEGTRGAPCPTFGSRFIRLSSDLRRRRCGFAVLRLPASFVFPMH